MAITPSLDKASLESLTEDALDSEMSLIMLQDPKENDNEKIVQTDKKINGKTYTITSFGYGHL